MGARTWIAFAAAVAAALLGLTPCASAVVPTRPPLQPVTVVGRGAVWFRGGPVLLEGFSSPTMRLGGLEQLPQRVASSATGVAGLIGAEDEGEFFGSVPPSPFVTLGHPPLRPGAGCKGWLAGRDFVVAADELVAAGECNWENVAVRQPLFVHSLSGGRWRVLRWLPGDVPPILAAGGNLLAIGVQVSSAQMDVSILDIRTGRTQARFVLPDAYLAFASPNRLVLSADEPSSPGAWVAPEEAPGGGPYRLWLYSTRGQRIADLGSAGIPPLVSGMHMVADEEGTITVRGVTGGGSREVVGFDDARELDTFAFRWPALAVVQATRLPRLPSEVGCWTPEYGPVSSTGLEIFDLARDEPFMAAPPLVKVQPSQPLSDCGPAPP